MAKKTTTAYLTTYNLSEFDMRNIERLEERTGYSSAGAIYAAVYFCQKSLDYAAQGYVTTALYETFDYRATTASLDPQRVAQAYNARTETAEKIDLTMYRNSDFLQALQDIKKTIRNDSDSVALAFALEYAAQMVTKLENANNGKKAQIFFSPNGSPRDRGYVMKKHPFNISLGNRFRKAACKMKDGTKGIFVKRKPSIHTAPAKKPEPAPERQPEQKAEQKTEQQTPAALPDAGDKMHNGTASDLQPMKPLTLKNRKGGKDGFSL
ncbi:MAG: hypothetical protein GC185_00620 [Alphaproteobacteria bacterium]|nr:hypothetical protein [Alphaproteobacteria bacterium]